MAGTHLEFGPGLDTLNEKQFQAYVVQAGAYLGWRESYHTHDSRKSDKGFPDLVMVNESTGGLLFLELKTKKVRPTVDQVKWVRLLRLTGNHAYVVYPKDMDTVHALFREEFEKAPAKGTGSVTGDLYLLTLNEMNPKVR